MTSIRQDQRPKFSEFSDGIVTIIFRYLAVGAATALDDAADDLQVNTGQSADGEDNRFNTFIATELESAPSTQGYGTVAGDALYTRLSQQRIIDTQLNCYLGSNGNDLLTIYDENSATLVNSIADRLRLRSSRIRNYTENARIIVDLIELAVERIFPVLEIIGEELEHMEIEILGDETSVRQLQETHRVKRGLLTIRRVVWPTREVLSSIRTTVAATIGAKTQAAANGTYDHLLQIIEMVDTSVKNSSPLS